MMLDSGKKKRGGKSCGPYFFPSIFGFHDYYAGVHCNADVTSPNSVPPGKEMQHSAEELNLSDQKMGIM